MPVISFRSLEDRMSKATFRRLEKGDARGPEKQKGDGGRYPKTDRFLQKKSKRKIPRSRSAKLRCAEKVMSVGDGENRKPPCRPGPLDGRKNDVLGPSPEAEYTPVCGPSPLLIGGSLVYVWSRIQVIQAGYEISNSLKAGGGPLK